MDSYLTFIITSPEEYNSALKIQTNYTDSSYDDWFKEGIDFSTSFVKDFVFQNSTHPRFDNLQDSEVNKLPEIWNERIDKVIERTQNRRGFYIGVSWKSYNNRHILKLHHDSKTITWAYKTVNSIDNDYFLVDDLGVYTYTIFQNNRHAKPESYIFELSEKYSLSSRLKIKAKSYSQGILTEDSVVKSMQFYDNENIILLYSSLTVLHICIFKVHVKDSRYYWVMLNELFLGINTYHLNNNLFIFSIFNEENRYSNIHVIRFDGQLNILQKNYFKSGYIQDEAQIMIKDMGNDDSLIASVDAGKRLLMIIAHKLSQDYSKTFIASMCIIDQTITSLAFKNETK